MPKKRIIIELDVKVTNKRGSWAILRAYPHTSNMYQVYGYECWSDTYDQSLAPMVESDTHMSRKLIERQMRSFLHNR